MTIAHTRPGLLSRIEAARFGPTTIPAGETGARPVAKRSFTDRYSDTEYATPVVPVPTKRQPMVATGRMFVIVSGSAVTTLLATVLLARLG